MKKVYLGIDIGSISTKGVIIDEDNNILASSYLYTEGSPITASKRVVRELKNTDQTITSATASPGTNMVYGKITGTIEDYNGEME